jgi:AraC-like DNA-binding protein
MPETLFGLDADGLERSCRQGGDSIRFGAGAAGVERAEVHLSTHKFELHRHDTYAIGITTSGVQTFHFRGSRHVCLPGQLHILHPDELHEGAAGTDDGFSYRIVYMAPELIRQALDGGALPFVASPVKTPTGLIASLLTDIDEPIDDLRLVELATAVADFLRALSQARPKRQQGRWDVRAMATVREYLAAHAREPAHASTLERIAGADRFTIARHFRRAFGTSPDRYRTLRRLDLARSAIESGQPLARVAAETGFADQSHMTRQFKRTFGLTPAQWAALSGGPGRGAARAPSGRG